MATTDRYVEIYEDAGGGWRWRRIATGNGRIVADGAESYTRKDDARDAAASENPDVESFVVKGEAA